MGQGVCLLSSRPTELTRDVDSQVDLSSLESLFSPGQSKQRVGQEQRCSSNIRGYRSWGQRLLGEIPKYMTSDLHPEGGREISETKKKSKGRKLRNPVQLFLEEKPAIQEFRNVGREAGCGEVWGQRAMQWPNWCKPCCAGVGCGPEGSELLKRLGGGCRGVCCTKTHWLLSGGRTGQ